MHRADSRQDTTKSGAGSTGAMGEDPTEHRTAAAMPRAAGEQCTKEGATGRQSWTRSADGNDCRKDAEEISPRQGSTTRTTHRVEGNSHTPPSGATNLDAAQDPTAHLTATAKPSAAGDQHTKGGATGRQSGTRASDGNGGNAQAGAPPPGTYCARQSRRTQRTRRTTGPVQTTNKYAKTLTASGPDTLPQERPHHHGRNVVYILHPSLT